MYTALHIKQTTNKGLLHSTGNSTHSLWQIYMERESAMEWIYVYVQLNPFARHMKLTQQCKSTILQYIIKIKF